MIIVDKIKRFFIDDLPYTEYRIIQVKDNNSIFNMLVDQEATFFIKSYNTSDVIVSAIYPDWSTDNYSVTTEEFNNIFIITTDIFMI